MVDLDRETQWLPTLPAVADLLTVGVIIGDPDGSARYISSAWTQITGQSVEAAAGHGWLRVLPVLQFAAESSAIAGALEGGEGRTTSWKVMRPDGERRSLAVSINPARRDGATVGFVATIADVTASEADARLLVHQATHDPMTGLLNRMAVEELVRHALDRGRRAPDLVTALLFIDVDALKVVNDRYGHQQGDQLLQVLSHRIRDAVRPVDAVARYGGDEFVVLCEDLSDPLEASLIAQRIIDAAEVSSGDDVRTSVSVGVAFAGDPDSSAEELVRQADQAMYRAKLSGGGDYEVAEPGVSALPAPPPVPIRPSERVGGPEVGEVLAVVARELKEPQTTVEGLVAVLHADDGRLSIRDRAVARDALERQVRRLGQRIDDLVDLSRPADVAGIPALARLDEILAEALTEAPAPQRTAVVLRMQGDRASARAPLWLERAMLVRVLVNLLTNAYQYGGPEVRLRIKVQEGVLTLTVHDDGPGVPPTKLPTLFTPYEREDDADPPSSRGLGLPLCHVLLTAAGGTLSYAPGHPAGSDFTLRLSIAVPAPEVSTASGA